LQLEHLISTSLIDLLIVIHYWLIEQTHGDHGDESNDAQQPRTCQVVVYPEVGDQAPLQEKDGQLRGKEDLLEHLPRRVDLLPINCKQVVGVDQVPEAEEEEAAERDERDETREDDDDCEDGEFLRIVETIEEDHAFSSPPWVRIVNVFAAIVCEPGRQESGQNLPWPDKVDAKREACVLNNE